MPEVEKVDTLATYSYKIDRSEKMISPPGKLPLLHKYQKHFAHNAAN